MVIDKKVAGAAAATTIASGMTPTVPGTGQTFTVADDTGYPATGAFVVVIDRGQDAEEKILVSSRSGVTFTVGSRGYDGTTAGTHTIDQATCEHALDAVAVQALIDHVDGVEVNPHDGVLLDDAAHDVEARHQFGSGLAFGVPVTPTALTPGTAGSAGSGNNPAREDHIHNLPTAAATTTGLANSEGTAATLARSDHGHALIDGARVPAGAVTMYVAATAPTGWLVCDGTAVNRTTYADLFAVIGTSYGAGDGATTFNVPDMRAKFPFGYNPFHALGVTGGTYDHTHTLTNAVAHITMRAAGSSSPWMRRVDAPADWTPNVEASGGVNAATYSGGAPTNDGAELGGSTDAANPPYLTFQFIIKT